MELARDQNQLGKLEVTPENKESNGNEALPVEPAVPISVRYPVTRSLRAGTVGATPNLERRVSHVPHSQDDERPDPGAGQQVRHAAKHEDPTAVKHNPVAVSRPSALSTDLPGSAEIPSMDSRNSP